MLSSEITGPGQPPIPHKKASSGERRVWWWWAAPGPGETILWSWWTHLSSSHEKTRRRDGGEIQLLLEYRDTLSVGGRTGFSLGDAWRCGVSAVECQGEDWGDAQGS
jgi:hypothetical protein